VVRIRNDGIRLRGHSSVLLSSYPGTPTIQEGNRSTTTGMEHAEGDRTTDEREIPNSDDDGDVFLASGSLQPRRSAIVSGMLSLSIGRTVTFSDTVTMYTPIDWSPSVYHDARKGPWMQHAVDRHRFKRRIKQTEKALGDIFSDTHRDKVKRRLLFYARRERVKRRLLFE
jgi:hypothetical protein